MLNKLLKYEFKSTARTLLPLYGVVIVLAIVNKIILEFKGKISTSETFEVISGIFSGLSIFLYVAVLVGLMVTTFVIIVQRFRKNLLGDEGYLMNTLPVKPWQNILSKLIIAMLWTLVGLIVGIITIIILAYHKDIFFDIRMMWYEIKMALSQGETVTTIMLIASYLVNFVGAILLIYVSLCIGSLFSQYRVIASFAAYLVIDFAKSTIALMLGVLIMGLDMFATSSISGEMTVYLGVNLVFSIVLAIVYYFGCEYILAKKLNLE